MCISYSKSGWATLGFRLRMELSAEILQETRTGTTRSWHENGELAEKYELVDGVVVGGRREWHDNGVLAKTEPHVSGRFTRNRPAMEHRRQLAWKLNGERWLSYLGPRLTSCRIDPGLTAKVVQAYRTAGFLGGVDRPALRRRLARPEAEEAKRP